MNVHMWIRALQLIPRISKEEWDSLDVISRWLIATRAAVFVMTATSCGIAGLLAWKNGVVNWGYFAACMVGLVFAHGTNNLLNDVTDHLKGIDKDNYYRAKYGPQPLEHGLMTMRQMLSYVLITGLVAAGAGAFLIVQTGTVTLYLTLAGAFFVLFYTWPLKYIGMGEPSVLFVWGPLMVGGSYYVISGGIWSWEVVGVGTVYALGPTTVLFGKHTDKLEEDRQRRVFTLPVIISEAAARWTTLALLVLQYAGVFGLVASGHLHWACLVVVLAGWRFVRVVKVLLKPRPDFPPEYMPPDVWPLFFSAHAFVYGRTFGLLLMAGLLVHAMV